MSADTLSFSPNLLIEGNSTYRTITGGFISIVLFVLSIIGIIYFGQDLWIKSKPNVVVSATNNNVVGPFEINEKVLNVYFAVEYIDDLYYVDPTIYNFTALVQINDLYPNGTQTFSSLPLEIDLCNKYYKSSTDISLNGAVDIDVFWCIKPNVTYVTGYWGQLTSYVAHVYLNKCTNFTGSSVTCKSQETIDGTIQGGYLAMYAINNVIDMNNYTEPVHKNLQNVWTSLNVDLTFEMVYSIQQNSFSTDVGIFLEDFQEITYSYFDTPQSIYYGKRGSLIADITMQGVQNGSSIKRTYIKIQDVVTKIGGMLKALALLGQAISYLSSKIEFTNDFVFNSIYKLKHYYQNEVNNKSTNNAIIIQKQQIDIENKFSDILVLDKNGKKEHNMFSFPNKLADISNFENSNCKLNFNNPNQSSNIIPSKKNLPITESNKFYSIGNMLNDYASQIFFCLKCNTDLTKQRVNISSKISKILSVDYLLFKFYLIELLTKSVLEKKNDIGKIEKNYLEQLLGNSNENILDAFIIPSHINDSNIE